MSQPNLNAMLNCSRSISKQTAVKLHELYGLSVLWILAGDGNMIEEITTKTVNINSDGVKVGVNVIGGIHHEGILYFLASFNKKAPNLTVRCQNKKRNA